MYEQKTAKLVLHCWLATPPDSPVLKDVVTTVNMMFSPEDHLGNSSPPGYIRLAFDAFKVTTFVSQINFILKHKKLAGDNLILEISAISQFVKDPFFPHILEAKVHKQLIAAVRKQLKTGVEDANLQDLADQCGYFIQ